jgi:hypothetical protein
MQPSPNLLQPKPPGSSGAAPIASDRLPDLALDLLHGAEEIAQFLFGSAKKARVVYRLSTEVRPENRLPLFTLGDGTLCGRRSTLMRWISEREAARQQT